MKLHALLPFTAAVAAVPAPEESTPPGGVPPPLPVTNLIRELASCRNLSCSAEPANAVCAREDDDSNAGVALVEKAMELPSANLSLTLVDGLEEDAFMHYKNSLYRYSDVRLFAGLDPEDDPPEGCLLMIQYQQQTFPQIRYADEREPPDRQQGTTDCKAVLDPFCQSDILKMIRSFNATDESDRCEKLVAHVAQGLRRDNEFCGEGPFLANLMNVTGGSLPSPEASLPDGLGTGECKPVLPSSYGLYPVAQQRQYFLSDPPSDSTEYYSHLFGGRAGFTPVIGVFYNDTDEPDVQFLCLQTLKTNGEKREAVFEAGASELSLCVYTAVFAVLISCLL